LMPTKGSKPDEGTSKEVCGVCVCVACVRVACQEAVDGHDDTEYDKGQRERGHNAEEEEEEEVAVEVDEEEEIRTLALVLVEVKEPTLGRHDADS
jgi:hypothetical protein